MHSIAPYTLRCFDPKLSGSSAHDKYAVLDKIGSFDTFDILTNFIESRSANYEDIPKNKQVFKFTGVNVDPVKRVICGWLEAGTYGTRSDIINVQTQEVDFKKAEHNADIARHYIYIFMPLTTNEAIALLHSRRGHGIKTLLFEEIGLAFNTKTQKTLQMNPLSSEKAMNHWIEAQAKEIRLIKFVGALNDIADEVSGLGHSEQELKLKPPRKTSMGILKDYLNPNSEQRKAIEILTPLCSQVKTVVELNGRKRIFNVGPSAENTICEIEAPDDLEVDGGNPTEDSMHNWCKSVAIEFAEQMYSGINFTL